MNRHENRAKDYLRDMLESLDRILRYTSAVDREQFLVNRMLQDAVIRNIEIVGEAAKQLLDVAPEFTRNHPELPFAQIYGMKSRIIHGYSAVDSKVVWDCVRDDVPMLQRRLAALLESLEWPPDKP